jgi:hypothetical protein
LHILRELKRHVVESVMSGGVVRRLMTLSARPEAARAKMM